jgi:Uma2 family endonuclease
MARFASNPVLLPPDQYLEMELTSPVKHEYIAGSIYAMTGSSDTHNLIALNLAMILRDHLKGTPCRVFMADVKVRIESANVFYYPDLMVSCESPRNRYYREQPILIVEVLSTSTANFDARAKRDDYQKLESLREYVLVSQECMDVRVYRRVESKWELSIYTDHSAIPLNSVELEIPIERIYEDVWG